MFCNRHKSFTDNMYCCQQFICRVCKTHRCFPGGPEEDPDPTSSEAYGICDHCEHGYHTYILRDWWDDLLNRLRGKSLEPFRLKDKWYNGVYWWVYSFVEWVWMTNLGTRQWGGKPFPKPRPKVKGFG